MTQKILSQFKAILKIKQNLWFPAEVKKILHSFFCK